MTRQERKQAAMAKRKKYASWMFQQVKLRFTSTNNWDGSIAWLGNRIMDKIKEKPQETELIVEATKLFRDIMKAATTENQLNDSLQP